MALNATERTENSPRRSSRIVRYLFLVVSVAFGLWVAELPKGNRVPPSIDSNAIIAPTPSAVDPDDSSSDPAPGPSIKTPLSFKRSLNPWSMVAIRGDSLSPETTGTIQEINWPTPESWESVVPGVELAQLEISEPRPIKSWLVRIDLRQRELQFVATPGNGDQPGETSGRLTSTFLTEFDCVLAINAGPYSPILAVEGQAQEISGLQIADSVVVSPADQPLPVLWQDPQGSWSISTPNFDFTQAQLAVPGFERILIESEVTGSDQALHPRTAIGISADQHSMIWLIVDGRQAGRSEGATTKELGQWLLALGMSDGINMDGGGTTTLVRRVDNELGYEVLNRPIHGGIPGLQRISASHLGLKVVASSE